MMTNKDEAREFAAGWLPAWTGNDPEKLAGYYSEDCLYLDPAIPDGVKGKQNLIRYFKKLLSRNPDWVWTQIEPIPMEGGFLNKCPWQSWTLAATPFHRCFLFRNFVKYPPENT